MHVVFRPLISVVSLVCVCVPVTRLELKLSMFPAEEGRFLDVIEFFNIFYQLYKYE